MLQVHNNFNYILLFARKQNNTKIVVFELSPDRSWYESLIDSRTNFTDP